MATTPVFPVTKVAIYKHGVAYFEREIELEPGSGQVDLVFHHKEINDVLKTLTVVDESENGVIKSVSYETSGKKEKTEKNSRRKLIGDGAYGMSELLWNLRGVKISFDVNKADTKTRNVCGLLVGIEKQKKFIKVDENTKVPTENHVVTMLDGDTVCNFETVEISNLKIHDEVIKEELKQSLLNSLDTRQREPEDTTRQVTIFAHGDKKRKIKASYVLANAVWKTSYRVNILNTTESEFLSKKGKIQLDPCVHLQGWAIVNNSRKEDWSNISLVLVSGVPISFRMELYTPLWKSRPLLSLHEEGAVLPPDEASTISQVATTTNTNSNTSGGFSNAFGSSAGPPQPAPQQMPQQQQQPVTFGFGSSNNNSNRQQYGKGGSFGYSFVPGTASVRKQSGGTRTMEHADNFYYHVDHPVTVKKKQSALVPILAHVLNAKNIAIYNKEVREKNPLKALLIKNNSTMPLTSGPITVHKDNLYQGEALMHGIKPGEQIVLPYGVELSVSVTDKSELKYRFVHSIAVSGASVACTRRCFYHTSYHFDNKGTASANIIVEHSAKWKNVFGGGIDKSKLKSQEHLLEVTDNGYRFARKATSNSITSLDIVEEGFKTSILRIDPRITEEIVQKHFKAKNINKEVLDILEPFVKFAEEMRTLNASIHEKRKELEQVYRDFQRIGQSLSDLEGAQDHELRNRWATELMSQEDSFRDIRKAIKELTKEGEAKEKEFNQKANDLSGNFTLEVGEEQDHFCYFGTSGFGSNNNAFSGGSLFGAHKQYVQDMGKNFAISAGKRSRGKKPSAPPQPQQQQQQLKNALAVPPPGFGSSNTGFGAPRQGGFGRGSGGLFGTNSNTGFGAPQGGFSGGFGSNSNTGFGAPRQGSGSPPGMFGNEPFGSNNS